MKAKFKLAWKQTHSLWRSGALNVLVSALILAVVAITSVGFFIKRVETALGQQGALLLGGDLAVIADHPVPDAFILQAQQQGITASRTYEFPSMIITENASQLSEIKAVEANFPLRGDFTLGQHVNDAGKAIKAAPNVGEVWIEPRLANLLDLQPGDTVTVGQLKFKVAAILLREPSRGGDMFSFAPRLMMNAADLPATGLIQFGSRIKYQLLLAGDYRAVAGYQKVMQKSLARGERIEDLRAARPEIKLALDKAQQFLGLSAMVSVMLGMVAMLLSSQPYINQSLDTFALMRCFGARQRDVLELLAMQTLLIALFSGLIGVVIAYFVQHGLATLAGSLFFERLPEVSWWPAWTGMAASLTMMLAVVLPHAWQMRSLTAVNILRRDTLQTPLSARLRYLPAAIVMAVMVLWQAGDIKIGSATLAAMLALCLAVAAMIYALFAVLKPLLGTVPRSSLAAMVVIGLQHLRKRLALSAVQMAGFSMGLTVLMLLSLVRTDLIRNWQASLPADAPNRFVINIQPDQIARIQQFFAQQHIKDASIFPMVKGRLVKINDVKVSPQQWQQDRARRLAEREFNLSWAAEMQSDNKLNAGRWWTASEHGQPMLSLEQGLADTLGIRIGDRLVFDVAGQPLQLEVTSLRKVDWDTMRANFFAVTPPGVLEDFPASHISSFYLPAGADMPLNQLVKTYPNLTVIDVAALMQQVRGIMQKMSLAVEYVFIFSLLAGMCVLYAALVATRDERVAEATLMRIFGASRRQVELVYFAEFACIGLIAALMATLTSNLLAYYVSVMVMEIPFQFNLKLALLIALTAAIAVPLAAFTAMRRYLNLAPRQLLNSI